MAMGRGSVIMIALLLMAIPAESKWGGRLLKDTADVAGAIFGCGGKCRRLAAAKDDVEAVHLEMIKEMSSACAQMRAHSEHDIDGHWSHTSLEMDDAENEAQCHADLSKADIATMNSKVAEHSNAKGIAASDHPLVKHALFCKAENDCVEVKESTNADFTCGDIKELYKQSACCGMPNKRFDFGMRRLSTVHGSTTSESTEPSRILRSIDLALEDAKATGGAMKAKRLAKMMLDKLAKY